MPICKYCGLDFPSIKSHSHHCKERIRKNEKVLKKYGNKIITDYNSGISIKQLMDEYGISWKTVANHLKSNNTPLRTLAESYTPVVKKKQRDALLRIYGENVDNISQLQEIKDKVKKTMLEKYGVENISHSQRFKDFMYILKGNALDRDGYNKYKREVWQLTKKNIKNKQFTGVCHYTGVSISKDSYYNDFHHASIDHKISLSYGFNNDIPANQIGAEDNLCYCSRLANTVKREMTEEEFLKSDVFRRLIAYENKINTTPAS